MENIIEIDDRLIVPPPWSHVLASSGKVPGEMDDRGRYRVGVDVKPLIEKMIAANMVPAIMNPADTYVSRGEYSPWHHQRLMMQVYVAHTRAYNYADLGCVDDQTEFLSPDGWKPISKYEGQAIAVDIDCYGNPVWDYPVRYINEEYTGDWVHINVEGFDQMLTPDHRVPIVCDGRSSAPFEPPNTNGYFNKTINPSSYSGTGCGFLRASYLAGNGGENGKALMLAGCLEDVSIPADGEYRPTPRFRFLLCEPGEGNQLWTARYAAKVVSPPVSRYDFSVGIHRYSRKYCFTTRTGVWLMRRNGKVAVTGNSGKSGATLWAFDLLKNLGRVDKLLVVTPLSTVEAAWGEDAKSTVPHLRVAYLIGSKKKRLSAIEADQHDVFVINHDGAKTVEPGLVNWCKKHKVMCVYDEATAIKLYTTARSKTARHLFNASARRYVLTATPVVQNLIDSHGLLTVIDNVPFPKTLTAFRHEFFVMAGPHKWVPKATAYERLQVLMSPAIRLNTRDLIDLPENVLVRKWPAMTKEQDAAYQQMQEALVYEHNPAVIITAANAAVQMNKLIQITCGIMHAEDQTVSFQPTGKLEALMETIDESQSKVLIFVPYTAVIDQIVKFLEDKFYPGCTAVIDGRVAGNKRGEIVKRFQDPEDEMKFIVAHPRAASHGLTLTEADTTVWFAPYLSAESFVQANARIDRPGQKRTTRTVMLASSDLERDLYKTLLEKKQTNVEFVQIYNAMISSVAKKVAK